MEARRATPWELPSPRAHGLGPARSPGWAPAPGEPIHAVGSCGRSSPGQVPRGQTRPGGCKPQAKVEKGRSLPTNPFYTVKTAGLSPKRPLFNLEAHGGWGRPKLAREHSSFPVFLTACLSSPNFSTKSCLSGAEENRSAPWTAGETWALGARWGSRHRLRPWPPRSLPAPTLGPPLCVAGGHVLQASPPVFLSLGLEHSGQPLGAGVP